MPVTVKKLIENSLREIRVLAEGEQATADMIEDAKQVLVDLLNGWSVDGLKVPYYQLETWNLVDGQSAYYWGVTYDFNSQAPVTPNDLIAVSWVFAGLQKPLRSVSVRQILEVPFISTISNPNAYYFDLQSIPVLRLDCIPYGPGQLITAAHKPLDADFELTDEIEFPSSYSRALRTNLAIDLAPGYGKEVGPTLANIANKARKAIEKVNVQPIPEMRSDVPGAGAAWRSDAAPLTSPWTASGVAVPGYALLYGKDDTLTYRKLSAKDGSGVYHNLYGKTA